MAHHKGGYTTKQVNDNKKSVLAMTDDKELEKAVTRNISGNKDGGYD
jgi:hypothetical protein